MTAYTRCGFEGAMATSRRPHGAGGRPGALVSFRALQVAPPSSVRYNPEPDTPFGPSLPERKVPPLRRKSHSPAKRRSGLRGSIARPEQPVDRFGPFSTSVQLFPPSTVLYSPRCGESDHNLPGPHAYTTSPRVGCTMIRFTRSDSGSPIWSQVSPPSLERQMPLPIDAELRVQLSPVPTQTTFGSDGSSAMAPIDCTPCLSKTGLNVVP